MKWLSHPGVTGAGLSFVCCFGLIEPLVSPRHAWIYHDGGAIASIFLPIMINVVLLWVLFSLLLLGATRSPKMRVIVWFGVILFTPSWLLKDVFPLLQWRLPHGLEIAITVLWGLCWITVAGRWRHSFVPMFEHACHFSSRMLSVAALGGLLVIGQMFWYCWDARSLCSPHRLHFSKEQAVTGERGQRPRVIWIILDELSYQQVYGRRLPSLDLPAFDQLASQSTVFTHVVPAAIYTEAAVPSLMTGLRVDRIRAGGDGTLDELHDPMTGRWRPFVAQDTVFQDALSHGFRTGIAGWYNPYCRILADVLDGCRWVYREEYEGGMFSDASIRSNLVQCWRDLLVDVGMNRFEGTESSESVVAARAHIADYRDIVSAGDQLLQDPSINFMLLHVPVPHPGGIYNRRTGTFTTHRSSYIDNLALADIYLAHVRQVLQQRGEWDSSAIVVMGDHSWRTKLLWAGSPQWTAEDEIASRGGQFDDRPAYIVKLPHQTEAARVESSFAAVKTRALLGGLVDGSIRSVSELVDFAEGPPGPVQRPELVTTRVEGAGSRSHDK